MFISISLRESSHFYQILLLIDYSFSVGVVPVIALFSKWLEPRSISSSYSVMVRVRAVVVKQQQLFSELPSPGRSHCSNY